MYIRAIRATSYYLATELIRNINSIVIVLSFSVQAKLYPRFFIKVNLELES